MKEMEMLLKMRRIIDQGAPIVVTEKAGENIYVLDVEELNKLGAEAWERHIMEANAQKDVGATHIVATGPTPKKLEVKPVIYVGSDEVGLEIKHMLENIGCHPEFVRAVEESESNQNDT